MTNKSDVSSIHGFEATRGCLDIGDIFLCPKQHIMQQDARRICDRSHSYRCSLTEAADNIALVMSLAATLQSSRKRIKSSSHYSESSLF